MNINEAREGLFTIKIEIGQFFWKPENDVWIKMREFTVDESREVAKLETGEWEKWITDKFEDLLTDFNFYDDEKTKSSNADVSDLLKLRVSCFAHIMREYQERNPFAKSARSSADRSPSIISTENTAQDV